MEKDFLEMRKLIGPLTKSTIFYWELLYAKEGIDGLVVHSIGEKTVGGNKYNELEAFLKFLRRDDFPISDKKRKENLRITTKLENFIDSIIESQKGNFERDFLDVASLSDREKNFLICLLLLEIGSWRIGDERRSRRRN